MLRAEGKNLRRPYVGDLGEGLLELRDARQSGPGYRLYFCWEGDVIVILLGGGEKSSQQHDIAACRERMLDLNLKTEGK
jgi:putative addiction module killer protein